MHAAGRTHLILAHAHEVDNVGVPAGLQDGALLPEGFLRLGVIDPIEFLDCNVTVQVAGFVHLQPIACLRTWECTSKAFAADQGSQVLHCYK